MPKYKDPKNISTKPTTQNEAQDFIDLVIEDLFNYPPKITSSRQERINLLDNYFNDLLDNGMPWKYYPEDYSQLLFFWENIHFANCLDLLNDTQE